MMLNEQKVYRPRKVYPWTARMVSHHWRKHCAEATTRAISYHADRPKTRADCPDKRPCPWATCRHHLAINVLAAAERGYRNPDNRKIPVAWGAQIEEGDFGSLPFTCVLDLIESRGRVSEDAPLYDAIHEAETIGDYLGLSRERVRQNLRSAIASVAERDPDVAEWLAMAYEASKVGG